MLVALGTIAAKQSIATQTTSNCVNHLLDYCHTHPDAKLCYHARDTILHIHSFPPYNSEVKTRSQSGGHCYLSNTASIHPTMINNGYILKASTIICNVMESAYEAECGSLFINTKETVFLRTTLHEMGHPQFPTTVEVDNSTAVGFENKKFKQQKSNSIDMPYYWIQDRVAKKTLSLLEAWPYQSRRLFQQTIPYFLPQKHKIHLSIKCHSCLIINILRGCVDFFPRIIHEWADPFPGLIHEWTHPT